MSLKDYIHNLQQRPEKERERIAYLWTAIGFSVILLIWFISFREMNKPVEAPVDQMSASLQDLKANFQEEEDSIQNMMQNLPSETGSTETENIGAPTGDDSLNMDNNSLQNPSNIPEEDNNSSGQNDQKKPSVPPLP